MVIYICVYVYQGTTVAEDPVGTALVVDTPPAPVGLAQRLDRLQCQRTCLLYHRTRHLKVPYLHTHHQHLSRLKRVRLPPLMRNSLLHQL